MTNRRDLCLQLPALALFAQAFSAASAQEGAPTPEHAATVKKGTEAFAHNRVIRAADYPIKTNANGTSQALYQGVLPTGEGVEMHNTTLLPGHEPHPPHQHVHSEWLLIREGNVEWLVDGKREPAGPGDILYASSGQMHGVRNTGTTTARYFVMAVGPNLKA
jgi:mannose-6-phosphate isomerase-like protein (cupin superfamily)